jgi:hypothetical protein
MLVSSQYGTSFMAKFRGLKILRKLVDIWKCCALLFYDIISFYRYQVALCSKHNAMILRWSVNFHSLTATLDDSGQSRSILVTAGDPTFV